MWILILDCNKIKYDNRIGMSELNRICGYEYVHMGYKGGIGVCYFYCITTKKFLQQIPEKGDIERIPH